MWGWGKAPERGNWYMVDKIKVSEWIKYFYRTTLFEKYIIPKINCL